jgi:hypothetical protein
MLNARRRQENETGLQLNDSTAGCAASPALAIPCAARQHCSLQVWFYLKGLNIGAGDRDRTGDIQLGKLAFYR